MKTLDDLLAACDRRRSTALAKYERAQQSLYARVPGLQRLETRRRAILMGQMQDILAQPGEKEAISAKARADAAAISGEIDALLAACKETRPALRFSCPACEDTGFVEGKLCACVLRQVFVEIYGGTAPCDAPGSFASFDETVFPPGPQRARMAKMRAYLEEYCAEYPQRAERTILFSGGSGLGKSFLLGAIAKALEPKTGAILFIPAFDLFSLFHKHRLGEFSLIQPIFDADALFLDDLGTEPMTSNVTREYMFRLIESRQASGRLTVIATNLSLDAIKSRYTEKVSSRLLAGRTSLVFPMSGEDIRLG